MSVIDVHTHAFPDRLARRAIRALQAEGGCRAFLDGRIKSLLKSMDAADIDVAVVCSIATRPGQVENIFKWSLKIRSDRIEPLASIHPDTPQKRAWAKRFAEAGLTGIKVHPMYQHCRADEPRALQIYEAAAEANLVVVLHCGRDMGFPDDSDSASPARVRRALRAVPGMKLLATHMGGWGMWAQAEAELVGTDCYLDTSFTSELPAERMVEMIRRHGSGRILFGTDSPWTDQAEQVRRIRCLGLTRAELDGVLFSNAARLLRI